MIFALATDERSLFVFDTEKVAISHCEGIDVEDGGWLFWDDRGQPLAPKFNKPNHRGSFVVANGVYSLEAASQSHHPALADTLDKIANFNPPFESAARVRAHLLVQDNA
jgi:hypothetical protein